MANYQVVIKNALIIDPEQEMQVLGNLAIENGKIAEITIDKICGDKEIDAKGHVLCPGFIDVHGHIDGDKECAVLAVLQGVTTVVSGNCGLGPVNLEEFFHEQEKKGFPINQAQLVGHSFSLREAVGITSPYVPANQEQILEMLKLADKAFSDGAIGLSLGLEYAPGYSHEEILELSKLAAKHGKLVAVHTNVKAPGDLESLEEVINISRSAKVSVLVSHFVYQYGSGLTKTALEIVERARNNGVDIRIDSGMYTDFATSIGTTTFDEENIKKFGMKLEELLVVSGKYKGQNLNKEIYDDLRKNSIHEGIVCFSGREEDIYDALSVNYAMVSSDIAPNPSGALDEGHPQNAGTFPKFFRKMVREKNILSLIDAVAKCTIVPADTFKFKNKGRLTVGADADIVIFDIENILDTADFPGRGEPDGRPQGIYYVIVNGEVVVENGELKRDVLPGKIIK